MTIWNLLQVDFISGLFGFVIGILSFLFINGWRQHQEKQEKSDSSITSTKDNQFLHWNPLVERRGLGDLLVKMNHIAITVSDVGRSLSFLC